MSFISYLQSKEISAQRDWDFSALVMAAMRKADTGNAALLRDAFPDIHAELAARYHAPGGALNDGERAWLEARGGTWANRTEVLWSNRPLRHQPSLFETEAAR